MTRVEPCAHREAGESRGCDPSRLLASAAADLAAAAALTDPADPCWEPLARARADLERLLQRPGAGRSRGAGGLLVSDLRELFAELAERHGVAVHMAAPGPDLPVAGDAASLGRALHALVEHSAAAGAGAVHVELTAGTGGAAVRCRPEVVCPVRGELGLDVACAVVEAHGGRVDLLPTAAGSCLRVRLCLAQ